MIRSLVSGCVLPAIVFLCRPGLLDAGPIIIDHTRTDITALTEEAILNAKAALHITYGHTSHGSQLITGMSGLVGFANAHGKGLYLPNNIFSFNNGGTGGALDLADTPFSGASDLGNPNFTAWETATRNYLNNAANSDVNVVIWSWCGQVSGASVANIDTYLNLMNGLEQSYPNKKFVYMTGHLDGGGLAGNLHQRNEQIRNYCRANNKILFDFADIESYNPDGAYFGNLLPDDNCDYDPDGALPRSDSQNWAINWQNSHTLGVDWYSCSPAHTQAVNGNLKAYAAWALWTDLAADVPGGAPFSDYAIPASTAGGGTTAALLDGQSHTARVIDQTWRAPGVNDTAVVSDVLSLDGLSPNPGDERFVLQLSYNPAYGDNVLLGWYDPASSSWVNAVEGNSDGGAGAALVAGAYDDNLVVGHWGVDPAQHVVWAVLDHNSDFGVLAVPEPAAWAMGLAGAAMVMAIRVRRRRPAGAR